MEAFAGGGEPVILGGCDAYREPDLTQALQRLLEPLGGMGAFVSPGASVLVKPNILSGRHPGGCVTANPLLVAAVARLAVEAGGRVGVGDSPGLERTEAAMAACGMAAALQGTGAVIVPFGPETGEVSAPPGATYGRFTVAKAVVDADVVINVAKLKTHGQMTLTLGVKNTLGCVVGLRKAEWHLKAGAPESFARMLLDLHGAVAPVLTILDGVVGMEGNGPMSGTPVHRGLLAASRSAPALDCTVTAMAGFSHEEVPTVLLSGLTPSVLTVERLRGAPSSVVLRPAAVRMHVGWLPLAPLRRLVRNAATVRPVFDDAACTGCLACARICPAEALRASTRGLRIPDLDLGACIRCFCCQEACPAGAVTVGTGWLGRILGCLSR